MARNSAAISVRRGASAGSRPRSRKYSALQLTGQDGALGEAEGSQRASQFVGGGGGLPLIYCELAGASWLAASCGFQNSDPLFDLRKEADPQAVESLGEGGLLGGVQHYEAFPWHAFPRLRPPLTSPARRNLVDSVRGSKGLRSTASTPRSAKRRWSSFAPWR